MDDCDDDDTDGDCFLNYTWFTHLMHEPSAAFTKRSQCVWNFVTPSDCCKTNLKRPIHVQLDFYGVSVIKLLLIQPWIWVWNTMSKPAQLYRQHKAQWPLVWFHQRKSCFLFFKLGHIFLYAQEMEILVPGWSVLLRRSPLYRRWRGEWQPRSTPCQSSSRSGPSFQFPLFRDKVSWD